MTAERLSTIVARTRESILNYAQATFTQAVLDELTKPPEGLKLDLAVIRPGDVPALGHLLYMCHAIDGQIAEGQLEKANRWVGFMQGVSWLIGVASIDESRKVVTESAR
jgi:hypothetical protein